MNTGAYKQHCTETLERLAQSARSKDELSYLFAVLGINSGVEEIGWQPINESRAFVQEFVSLINTPLHVHTKARLALVVYCHITEASFLYHDIFNLLLAADGQPPRAFNFTHKVRNGKPPSTNAKLTDIRATANRMGHGSVSTMFDEIWKPDIRNAVTHSDYILFENDLRIKHRLTRVAKIPLEQIFELLQKTLYLFDAVFEVKHNGLKSFTSGYQMTDRKDSHGNKLASVEVTVDENGFACGFRTTDPRPLW